MVAADRAYVPRMNLRTASLLALALVACGNAKQPTSPETGDTPTAVSKTPALPPAPPSPPTFAMRVNSATLATGARVDATALGTAVEAYLVTRYGAPGTQDAEYDQEIDRSIVLFGNGMALRAELGTFTVTKQQPFGAMTIVAPFGPRKFDPENDAFSSAPKWRSKAPVLLAENVTAVPLDEDALAVTQEGDELVVWSAELWWEEGQSDKWTKERTFTLANGAAVTAPKRMIEPPVMTDPLPVHVIEEQHASKTVVGHLIGLQIGDRVGPVAYAQTEPGDRATWVIHAAGITADALAARFAEVPAPLPEADAFLGHRLYQLSNRLDTLLLGRYGDELVMWVREQDSSPDSEWVERLRVPVPAGAKLDVR